MKKPLKIQVSKPLKMHIVSIITMYVIVLCVPGEWILSQKYAFIKKSTIFTQSLRNFVKMRSSYENLILTKFRNDWVKIVDFLIKAYF